MFDKWWYNAVVYQIYCKSFCDSNGDGIGDLQGVISKLPMLQELGINCIWFTPIFPSPQVDNGYDVADYKDIDPAYGNLEDFKQMLDLAHSLGIRVILDMVFNHSSDQHKWFQEAKKGKNNPYRNYYIWQPPKPDGSAPNNWGNYFFEGNGSSWEYDENSGEYYLHYYSAKMPDLNWEYAPLRQELYDVMRFWLKMGVDGFRMDVITSIKKQAGFPDSPGKVRENGYVVASHYRCNIPGIHEFLQEMRREVRCDRDYMLVGEGSNVTADIACDYVNRHRKELDSIYHFDICHRNFRATTVPEYKATQCRWAKVVANNGWLAQHLSNHDFPRQVSRFGDDGAYRVESAKLLATLTHTLPGTPYIYQGEEIGMTNVKFPSIDDYNDPYTVGTYYLKVNAGVNPEEIFDKLAAVSRDNPRTPYQWNSEKNAGFTTGTPWLKINPRYEEINLEKDRSAPDSIFAYYQQLIALRKVQPAITYGNFQMLLQEHEKVVMYLRQCATQTLLVIANFSGETLPVQLPEEVTGNRWQRILTNLNDTAPSLERTQWLPWEAEIYKMV